VPVFQRIEAGELVGVTSVITLTEAIVYPLRQGRSDLVQQYRLLLRESDHFELVDITPTIAEQAADWRARYNLRTPDALQLVAASHRGCDAFLTNDATLQRVSELRVLVLDALI
jgi:predicted nucleic acid-binding protein